MNPYSVICPNCGAYLKEDCYDLFRNQVYPPGIFHKQRISKAIFVPSAFNRTELQVLLNERDPQL